MLIVFGGLPATGKTTIARAIAQSLRAVYLRIDTIEQALRSVEGTGTVAGPEGYAVAYRVAEDNLKMGRDVVADCVNPLSVTRNAWTSVAEHASAEIAEVEVICSNVIEHRLRVERRKPDIDGLELPSWQNIMNRKYEPWGRAHIVVDTASRTVEETVADLILRLSPQRRNANK